MKIAAKRAMTDEPGSCRRTKALRPRAVLWLDVGGKETDAVPAGAGFRNRPELNAADDQTHA
jgi:hypothetical protein